MSWLVLLKSPLAWAAIACLSLAGNLVQWRAHGVQKAELQAACDQRIADAVLAGVKQAQAEADAKAEAIRKDAEKDRADLIAQVEALRKRGPERVTVYRDRVRDVPVTAKCGPGQARVDALNEALR